MSKNNKFNPEIFVPEIKNAMNFLAPYFGVSKEELKQFPFPSIKESFDPDEPYFNSKKNRFLLNKGDEQRKHIIGHETGHWFHCHINPRFWEMPQPPSLNDYWHMLRECIGNYAEVIYFNQKDPVPNPTIKLENLSRKEWSFCMDEEFQEKLTSLSERLLKIKEEQGII